MMVQMCIACLCTHSKIAVADCSMSGDGGDGVTVRKTTYMTNVNNKVRTVPGRA